MNNVPIMNDMLQRAVNLNETVRHTEPMSAPLQTLTQFPETRQPARNFDLRPFRVNREAYDDFTTLASEVVIGLENDPNNFMTTAILPLIVSRYQTVITVNVTHYTRSFATQRPELAPSEITTSKQSTREIQLMPIGIAIEGESLYDLTPVGQRDFSRKLIQAGLALRRTLNLMALDALLNTMSRAATFALMFRHPNPANPAHINHERVLHNYVKSFAVFHKHPAKAMGLVDKVKTEIPETNAIILPRGAKRFLAGWNEENFKYSETGPAGQALMNSNPEKITSYRGLKIYETIYEPQYRDIVEIANDSIARNPLVRRSQIGSYFVMHDTENGIQPIRIMDFKLDRAVTITAEEALKHCYFPFGNEDVDIVANAPAANNNQLEELDDADQQALENLLNAIAGRYEEPGENVNGNLAAGGNLKIGSPMMKSPEHFAQLLKDGAIEVSPKVHSLFGNAPVNFKLGSDKVYCGYHGTTEKHVGEDIANAEDHYMSVMGALTAAKGKTFQTVHDAVATVKNDEYAAKFAKAFNNAYEANSTAALKQLKAVTVAGDLNDDAARRTLLDGVKPIMEMGASDKPQPASTTPSKMQVHDLHHHTTIDPYNFTHTNPLTGAPMDGAKGYKMNNVVDILTLTHREHPLNAGGALATGVENNNLLTNLNAYNRDNLANTDTFFQEIQTYIKTLNASYNLNVVDAVKMIVEYLIEIINRGTLIKKAGENGRLNGSILIFSPRGTFQTVSMLVGKFGSDTGNTYVNQPNVMHGSQANIKKNHTHITQMGAAAVTKPNNYMVLDDVFVDDYLFGRCSKFISDADIQSLKMSGDPWSNDTYRDDDIGSLIAVFIPTNKGTLDNLASVIDMKGYFSQSEMKNNKNAKRHYPGANEFCQMMNLTRTGLFSDDNYTSFINNSKMNTVCFRGHQWVKNPDTNSFAVSQLDAGHLGVNIYPNMRESFGMTTGTPFEKMEYEKDQPRN